MKIITLSADEADKAPKGQCLLCYADNPYSVSVCVECSFPLPWAKSEIHERAPFGQCAKCRSENPYADMKCWACGAHLPWAYALSPVAFEQVGMTQLAMTSTAFDQPPHDSVRFQGDNSLVALDGRNRFVDAISFLCPALGFVAYVSLIGRLPMQASSAARFAAYGLWCVWVPAIMILLVRSR